MKSVTYAIAMLLSLVYGQALACINSDGPPGTVEDLAVVSQSLNFTESDSLLLVNTLGTLRNASAECFDEVVVEVKYFDVNSKLIDTITQPLYGVVVPGNQEVAFRVRDAAAQAKGAYASQSVRIVSANARGGRTTKQSPQSKLIDVLISWAPMLLLIGAWAFFMARMKRRDSPQGRILTMFEEQNLILASQSELLARIASALESHSSKRTDVSTVA